MGRPAKFCKKEAIEIALDTFWKHGYEATSVSELSTAMSITRSSFYNCFKTREDLFELVLERYQHLSPDCFLKTLPDDAPIVPAIREGFQILCKARAADPDYKGCLIINCLAEAEVGKSTAHKLVMMMQSKVTRYENLLNRAVAGGELDAGTDTEILAQALISQMIGLNMISKIIRNEEKLWAIADKSLTSLGLIAAG